jgi:hypothetical protein
MRQNTRNIKIHSLLKEKKKPEPVKKEFKTVTIPSDPKHTQFEVPVWRNTNQVIEKYLKRKKY